MHRNAALGDQKVVATKCAFFAEWHKLAIGGKGAVGQSPPQAGVGKQVADATFDVDPRVGFGRPRGPTCGIELVFHAMEVEGKSFEHAPAFLEGHLAECRATGIARKPIGRFKVNAFGGSQTNHVSCDGVVKFRALALALNPSIFDQILYLLHELSLFNEGTDSPVRKRSETVLQEFLGLEPLLGVPARDLCSLVDESTGSLDEFAIIFGQAVWRNQSAFSIFIA